VGETGGASQEEPGLTVALDLPSARILADQAATIQDLQYVMDCCKRLLTELAGEDRGGVVPLALWSSALVTYARCFGGGTGSGVTVEDVRNLPLQGEVEKFHAWVIAERDRFAEHPADPFAGAKIGAALYPVGQEKRRVEGIAVFATSRILIDATGVGQLGGLASELAKQTAVKAQKQQEAVLSDAQQLDMDSLYAAPPLLTRPSA
jgi:hypothetical protein